MKSAFDRKFVAAVPALKQGARRHILPGGSIAGPTSLVNRLYERLVKRSSNARVSGSRFLARALQVMRYVRLDDYEREIVRGAGRHVGLSQLDREEHLQPDPAFDEALEAVRAELATRPTRHLRVLDLRREGHTIDEIAEIEGVDRASINRDLKLIRATLAKRLQVDD